jgi:DNA repair ATPase RecN
MANQPVGDVDDLVSSCEEAIQQFRKKYPIRGGDLLSLLEDLESKLDDIREKHETEMDKAEREIQSFGNGNVPAAKEIAEALSDMVNRRHSKLAEQVSAFADRLQFQYPKFSARDLAAFAINSIP